MTMKKRYSSTRARRTKKSRAQTRRRHRPMGMHKKFTQKLKQARKAEKRATQQLSTLIRRHAAALEKMRRAIKVRLAQKARAAQKARKALAKKHATNMRKLRREFQTAMKQMRRQLARKTRTQTKSKRKTTRNRRRNTQKNKMRTSRRRMPQYKKKGSSRKVISLHHHRMTQMRRVA